MTVTRQIDKTIRLNHNVYFFPLIAKYGPIWLGPTLAIGPNGIITYKIPTSTMSTGKSKKIFIFVNN